jgi:hypothetical protein
MSLQNIYFCITAYGKGIYYILRGFWRLLNKVARKAKKPSPFEVEIWCHRAWKGCELNASDRSQSSRLFSIWNQIQLPKQSRCIFCVNKTLEETQTQHIMRRADGRLHYQKWQAGRSRSSWRFNRDFPHFLPLGLHLKIKASHSKCRFVSFRSPRVRATFAAASHTHEKSLFFWYVSKGEWLRAANFFHRISSQWSLLLPPFNDY